MLAQAAPPEGELVIVPARGPRVEAIWRLLEARVRPPYFLCWGWIENWLHSLPHEERPELAILVAHGAPQAAFFLGREHLVREPWFARRALSLNVTGLPARDDLCLEHNAILAPPSLRWSLARLVEQLPGDWEELALPALARDRFPGCALDEPLPHHTVVVDDVVPSPFVDLARVRAQAGGYLALLGAGVRAQIRRARRGFGPLALEEPRDRDEAQAWFDELVALHAARWHERALPGAFADPWIAQFHRRLIDARFGAGEIQLLRLRARGSTVGILYNFVANGRVLFYQSGLRHYDDPHLKAGYVCHAAAVEHNAARGHAVYDFLAGNARYKRELSTGAVELVWARVQRRSLRFAVEEQLRRWKRAWRGQAASGRHSPSERSSTDSSVP